MNQKPMAKYEAEHAKELGLSREEYRYRQACAWAILMGEEMPERKENAN